MKPLQKAGILAAINRLNDSVAVRMTWMFGSIWCVYAFLIFSLVPALVPQWQNTLLYISNCIQLVALPALMVGSALLNKAQDDRALEDHRALVEILSDVREELADIKLRTVGIARDTSEALQRPTLTDVSISDQTFVNLSDKPASDTP
ncbi:hypothetical protein [Acetobacter peroxydans]|uniref:DUF1003 domain-containing protein n=1 Tax=Acetobacter peroxydans TaxID=104098 RepID=A0A4Y3TVG8_9PROT|nr:hypothetical protein [Acetobacter peroxydans]NHO15025.1 hypothetical protein [Acetobacter peroxydans]GBR35975.1 hypothetical protein AA13755_1380 [Acetobacter peroxydans NBRC 13755]GBR40846.1 hypothetical protein AA0475_0814 [Acetobacter peroxydans]GEB85107.1 hypothetical protein APE01nite_09040 [Acetobacter peroxydans]